MRPAGGECRHEDVDGWPRENVLVLGFVVDLDVILVDRTHMPHVSRNLAKA